MYDYVDGKVDWMAYGLPVEGEMGPLAGSALVDVQTCRPEELAADVAARLEEAGDDRAVILAADRCAVASVELAALRSAAEGATAYDVAEPVPGTIRPSVVLSDLDERAAGQLVTTPEGALLGAVDPEAVSSSHHHHAHDHPVEEQEEQELVAVLAAVEERFGEHEPTREELRAFLRQRLLDEGRALEEADKVLNEMDEQSPS